MSQELVAIVGVGVAMIAATLPFNLYLIGQVGGLRERMAAVEQRLVHLEGMFEGFTGRVVMVAEE